MPPLLLLLLWPMLALPLLLRVLLLLRHTMKVPRGLGCSSRVGTAMKMAMKVRMKMKRCPHPRLSHPMRQQQQAEPQQRQQQGVRQLLPEPPVLVVVAMHSPQLGRSVGGTSQQGCSQS